MLKLYVRPYGGHVRFWLEKGKAGHAVICCKMERRTVTWSDSNRINGTHRSHTQRNRKNNSKTWQKGSEGLKKVWFCKAFQTENCSHDQDHYVREQHKHVCAYCASQDRILSYPEKDCLFAKKKK